MTEDRLTFSAAVDVQAEPEEVYDLIRDPRRKVRLNPNVQVLQLMLEGREPIEEGAVFYHRLRKGDLVFEYRSRCVRMVPPYLLETRLETDPAADVRVTVDPNSGGCRLSQEESFPVTPDLLVAIEATMPAERRFWELASKFSLFPGFRQFAVDWLNHRRERVSREPERVTRKLTGELEGWLRSIKEHIELRNGRRH